MIVTDHQAILDHAKAFGASAILSKADHKSGTDRIAELAESLQDYSRIINVQGDEPFIDPENIDRLVNLMIERNCDIATLAINQSNMVSLENPNVVKVVTELNGNALYFSRASIPFLRDKDSNFSFHWKKHIGIYGFKRDALLKITKLPSSSLEFIESLEQLRWLENGYQIQVGLVDRHENGIDTEEDLRNAIRYATDHDL
jgi:3-deoxy-manno-octulosonate cytidylyltransferase (CMP-KDO synthetase)